ncbi:MAG TPA: hypothetical protein VMB50_00710 [Myxococcales bacterium]|nr:hypothetical protein [Myxococcales bacterium]
MPRRLTALAALAVLGACQNYRFEKINAQPVAIVNQQVTIGAKLSPPDIMIVQDLSGSMSEPIQLTAPASGQSCLATSGPGSCAGYCASCSPGCGPCSDPTDCGSKMQLVTTAMTGILNGLKPAAGQLNMGLTSFGGGNNDGCVTGTIQVHIGDAVTTIPEIDQIYNSASPAGGTPTAATLQVAATDPALTNPDPSARKFIILVTDGLPNCSEDSEATACQSAKWPDGNTYGCASPNWQVPQVNGQDQQPPPGCVCSFGSCADPSKNTSDCCEAASVAGSEAPWYCLDDQGTENVIASLYANQNIVTYVVGLGYDYASSPTVLNAMAAAGHGSPTAFQASSPAALQTQLTNLIETVAATCVYTLDQPPVDPGLITVTLNGTQLQPNDPNGYTFSPPQTITINGTSCASITSGGSEESLQITAIAQ